MPQSGQIIPKYKHPHEEVYINDNTARTDYAVDNTGSVFLHVFASRSGRDRKLLPFNNLSDFINEFDVPNYRLYGQPMLNAYTCLQTGLAQSQSMRVTADDATFANMVLVAYYKMENAKLKLKFECVTRTGLREVDDLDAYITSLEVTEPNEEGYLALPIMTFVARGRGVYGNDYRIRISHDKNSDKYNGYKNYLIELLSTSEGFTKLETYNVAFYIDAIDPSTKMTLYINDIIDDENGKGSSRFNCELLYDNLAKIFEEYKVVYQNNGYIPPEIEEVDRLPGLALPSTETLYRLTAQDGEKNINSLWNFDDSGIFVAFKKEYATDVAKLPMIKPAALTDDITLWVDTEGQKVYDYNHSGDKDTMFEESTLKYATSATFAEILDPQEDTLYKITNSDKTEEGKPNGFYTYSTDDTDYTQVTTVYEATVAPPDGVGFADTTVVYHLTAEDGGKPEGSNWMVNTDGNDYEAAPTTTDVEKLPPTTVYEEGVVYKLTAVDGSKPIDSMWIYDATAEDYIEYVEEGPEEPDPLLLTMETFDIFGYNRITKEDDPFMEFDGGKEAIQILSIEGAPMGSGDDGALSEDKPASEREAALEEAYLKAFNGEFDKTILSKRRAPLVMMLDANYSFNVKSAMVALTLNRGDCTCHLDTGLIQNEADIDTLANRLNAFADRLIVKDMHMWKVIDPITGKIIPVTVTYWLSQKYPNHFNTYGNHVPLAGENYAVVTGYEKNSIRPIVDADDSDLKEKLYNDYHINYIEALDETTYIRGTQQTSQDIISDLSEENNMLVLLEIKRKLERLAASNRYNWSDPDSVRMYKEAAENIFSSYIGNKCQSLTLDVSYNDWENLNYIVHVYCGVVFRMFQKISIIEIDVNPRA